MRRRSLEALCLAALTASAGAQEPAAVVVTAPHWPLPAQTVAGPLNESAWDAPAQVTVIERAVLEEPGTHSVARAVGRDASVNENYATIGYWENFSIRGFNLDPGSGYRINGFVVPAEIHIAPESRERVEVLKGIGLLAAGASSPGGLINFVSRRPEAGSAARLEATGRGGHYLGLETGTSWLRLSAAQEELRPWADRSDGSRSFIAVAADAQAADSTRILLDAEFQHRSQFVVPGFQLLGGLVVPDGVAVATNINQQPWSRPVQNDAAVASLRVEHWLAPNWVLRAGVGHARARIEDNLAFPFGCNDPPVQYFCANGEYVLYDYHASEVRQSTHAQAALLGSFEALGLAHRFAAGAERIVRTVRQRNLWSNTLYDAAGRGLTGSLADVTLPLPAPPQTGIDRPDVRAAQASAYVADELTWKSVRVQAGLRVVRFTQEPAGDTQTFGLPHLALIAMLGPGSQVYASHLRGAEFGGEAPVTAENGGALLPPRKTRQTEIGWKHRWDNGSATSAALFDMRRPYDFIATSGGSFAGLGPFQRAGQQVHRGLEFLAEGKVAKGWRLSASAALIRAVARDTGEPTLEGPQIQNIPKFRSTAFARYAPQSVPGLELSAGWTHSGSRNARRDGLASVPGYDRLDAGLAWTIDPAVQVQLNVTNVTNRRYWRDASEAYSADLLFPGAPREIFLGLRVAWP